MNSHPVPLYLYITHVSAETACLKLWAQMDFETQYQIDTSLKKLEPMLESEKSRPHPVDIRSGDILCAKSSENGKWYRVKVTDLSSLASGKVGVKFIDYGDFEDVFINEVRKISHPVCSKPPLAKEFVLAGVRPMGTSWDDATVDFIEDMICYEEVEGIITGLDGGLPKVSIFIPAIAPEGFANYLIDNNRARADTPDKYIYRDIPIGKTVAAFTANVTSLSEFWIHLADGKDELRKMQVELEKFNLSCPKMSRVMVGAPCVTRFTKDGMLYRGEVLTENGINCQVLFVDYGNAEKKLVSELLDIPASLLAVPVQGIRCKLKESNQMTASEEMVQSFQDMVQDKQLQCNVVGRMEESYVVEVIVDERNVVNNLTECGRKKSLTECGRKKSLTECGRKKSLTKSGRKKSLTPTSSSSSSSSNLAAYQRKILDIGKAYEVKVSNAASLSSFHCQEISSIASLIQLVKQLKIEMNTTCQEVTDAELVPGFTCAMKNETNGDWYRAEVRKIVELGLVEIQCVDYGNVEIVSASRLVRLPSAYARNPPALATECALKGCTHIQSDLVDDFMRLAGTDKLIARVVEERNGKFFVDLHYVMTRPHRHINLEISCLHSRNRSVIPESSLVEIEQVYVVSVQDDGVVLAQLVKTPVETLGLFQEELNSYYGSLSRGSKNKYRNGDNLFHAGEICCAKFSGDDLFYRGKIVSEAKHVNAADVFFVDYGKTETKAIGEIKTLAPKFMSFPCQVIQIRIADLVCSAGMLRDNLMETTIEVRLVQKSNRVHSVVLTNDPMNDDIKKKLATTKSASVTKIVKKSRTPIPNLRAKEEVIATHVVKPHHICCQLQRLAAPLQELYTEISEHCASEDKTDILSDPVVRQACFDECYRAEMKPVINPKELENKLLEAETKLKVQVEQTNKLAEELTAVKKSEKEAKMQHSLKEERYKNLLLSCRQQISKVTSQRDATINDNEELKRKLGVEETASEEGNLRLNSLRSQYEGRISRLEKELKECQEEMESIQQDKEKIQKDSLAQLKQEHEIKLTQLEKELAQTQEKNRELTMQRDTFASESQVLKNEVKQWQTRTSQFVEHCNQTSADELKKANLEKDNLQKQFNEKIQRYRAEISRLNNSLLSVQNEVASLQANSVKEKKENDKVNEEIKKRDAQMAELVKNIQQVKKIEQKYKSQYDELKVQYDELKAKNDEMTVGVGDATTINAVVKQELENKLLEAKTKLKVQVEQTNKLTEELTAVQKSEEEAKTQNTLKKERSRNVLFNCRQQISKLISQRDAMIKDNEELKKLGVAETSSEEGNLRLNSLRSQYEDRISRFEKELKECQEEKESIQQEKKKIQEESEELLNILTQQQKQFIQYQAAKVSPTPSTAVMTGSTSSETPPTADIKPLATPTTAPVHRGTSNVLSSRTTPTASIRPMAIPQARKITQTSTTTSATESTHDEDLSAATHSPPLVPQATVAPTPATLVVTVTATPTTTTTNEQNTIASIALVPAEVDESQSGADPGMIGMPSSPTSPTPSTSDAIVDATSHVTSSAAISNLVSATTVTKSNSEENNSNINWSGNNNCDSPGESGSTLDLEFAFRNIKTEIVPADANTSEVTPSSSFAYDHDSKEMTLKRHREEIIGDDDPDHKRLYGTILDIKDRRVVGHHHLTPGSANARYGHSRWNTPRWWSSITTRWWSSISWSYDK